MRKRFYEAFTLVEMLIVMGILIILMVIGITAGRFAINRANDVAHQNAVDQIYQGLQAYYTDNRAFPNIEKDSELVCLANPCNVEDLIGEVGAPGVLGDYLDSGAFKGGTPASYIYMVGGNNDDQSVLVCVTLRGQKEDNDTRDDGAYYCNGNGFGDDTMPVVIANKEINSTDDIWEDIIAYDNGSSDWDGDGWE